MLWILIKRSFLNQKRAVGFMVLAVAIGTAVVASLTALSMDISNKVSRELRTYGANIIVEPKLEGIAALSGEKRYLREEDIVKAKTIFWRHNILGLAPFLEGKVNINEKDYIPVIGTWYEHPMKLPGEKEPFITGTRSVSPWWTIKGSWPQKQDQLLAGSNIARRLSLKQGSKIRIGTREFTITGIISTGDREDDALVGELDTVQAILGLQGKVSRVMVSALTTPMDDFAYRDPEKMSAAEYEKWYCTGYVTSIAKQLTEVFRSGKAKPVWPIAETEGKVLRKLSLLIYLLSFFTLLAAALGVSTTMVMSLLRRTEEIALMKATGADTGKIILIFLSEATITGMSGGTIGLILSLSITTYIGKEVFGTGLARPFILIPISLLMAMVISILGALLPIRKAIRIKPAVVLKGGGI